MFALAASLMILSGSLHAVVNALVKGGRDKMAARAATDGSSAVVMLPLVAFVPLPTGAWSLLALSAVIHAAYLFALVRAYEAGDFSAAYPAVRGVAPVVTAALSVGLLGERPSAADLGGVALIGGSICALVAGRHLSARTLGWSALTGIAVAAYTVVDAAGVRAAPTPASYIVWLFATMGPVVIATFAVATRGRVLAAMRAAWRPGAIVGLLSIGTYGAALYAFSLGPTAPLAALRETGVVTAMLIAAFVFGECICLARLLAVGGVLAGAVLILAG
jgi:drug/metabolite transporter (DMT)-like permease